MSLNVLIVPAVLPAHREQLQAAAAGAQLVFSCTPSDEELANADILVGNLKEDRLQKAGKLRLVQLVSAGAGIYGAFGQARGIPVCTASGAYGLAVSEHMFAMLLALQKRLPAYRDAQFSGVWRDLGPAKSLDGAHVLVLGLGDIGGSFAAKCKAFGAYVSGVTRTMRPCPAYADRVGLQADADAWLPAADVVFMCMPETEQTRGYMNAQRIARLKKGAILLNAGRGSAVDGMALCRALEDGALFGAALDVTDPEPLPAEHPLWKCANALITPHVSGGMHLPQTLDAIVRIACGNIAAYLDNRPLKNVIDMRRGF